MNTAARSGLAVAAVAGLGGVFLTGVAVGQLGADRRLPDPGVVGQPPLRLANADLRTPEDCQDLLDSYIDRSIDRVTAWGWHGPFLTSYDSAFPTELDSSGGVEAQAVTGSLDLGRATEQTGSDTGTNVQEAGVDEPDTVKTDGELLLRTDGGAVRVYDVTGDSPSLRGSLALPDLHDPELLLAGDQGVALGTDPADDGEVSTRVITFDLSDPSLPRITSNRTFSASTVRAVQHGSVVRLILSAGLPDLPGFVEPKPWRSQDSALAHNKDEVRDSTIDDWLPTMTTYDESGDATSTDPLVDCRRVAVPADDDAQPGTMPIVAFDPAEPDTLVTSAVATTTALAYASTDRLYLGSSGWGGWESWGATTDVCCPAGDVTLSPQELGVTRIYDFALAGLDTTYVASGEVDGTIRDRWAMDSHDGVLRVAVGPGRGTGDYSSVLTLTEEGSSLVLAGRVDRLGVDEQIKSVRWFDDLAIVVTFRQTDPLYAIDLSDPEHPVLAGTLHIPGYSEYLHPIGGDRILGVGQDATDTGMNLAAQVALFDVRDLAHPRRTDVVRFQNGSRGLAGQDPRQFTWLPGSSTALTVVAAQDASETGWVAVLKVDGDSITSRDVPVEYGDDVAQVRLVPLPSGKVVLVTGDSVSFFDV